MKCGKCGNKDTKVLESRTSHEGRRVRRRRSCLKCEHRFTTYEREEAFVFQIKKKDGRVEPYIHDKVFRALQIASRKRPITTENLEMMLSNMERRFQEEGLRTVSSQKLGDCIMEGLMEVDAVAYVRFASVYKDFQTPEEFAKELQLIT